MATSDPTKLQPAVEALLDELKVLDNQRTELVRTVNMLYRRMGKPEIPLPGETPVAGSQTIRPDQFFGRPLATAVTELLDARRSAMPLDEVVEALLAGGHQFRGEHPKRSLAIAISKNRKFLTVPNTDAVGLREWYPTAKLAKNGKVDDDQDEKNSALGADAAEGA